MAYHREASRLESLKNITERYDGYGNSIRKVMEQKKNVPGIEGVVADLIKVDQRYETAIETALGGSIQNIVTENEDTAKELIEYLKKKECYPQLLEEHQTIIDSIESRDKDRATQITGQHIKNQAEAVVDTIREKEESV